MNRGLQCGRRSRVPTSFNIKGVVYSFGGWRCSYTKSGSLNRQRQPLRGLAQEGECTSVGAGSPWPVAMIGAASGEKEKVTWTTVIANKSGVEKQKKLCTEQ